MSYFDVVILQDLHLDLLVDIYDLGSLYLAFKSSLWNLHTQRGRLLQGPDLYDLKIVERYGAVVPSDYPGSMGAGFNVQWYFNSKQLFEILQRYLVLWPNEYKLANAAQIGSLPLVKHFFSKIKIYEADMALRTAIQKGRLDIVKFLLENGVSIYAAYDVLKDAIRYGHLEVVKFLLDNNVRIYDADDALKDAKKRGHFDVVDYFVSRTGGMYR